MQHSQSLLREYIDSPVSVLAVTGQDSDLRALRSISINTQWRLYEADSISGAMQAIATQGIGVVITDRELPDGTWVDFLECVRTRRNGPRLIVYSPVADTRFWADVLSMGGYDVLASPFCREEVLRVAYIGWRSWSRASRVTPAFDKRNVPFGLLQDLSRSAKAN